MVQSSKFSAAEGDPPIVSAFALADEPHHNMAHSLKLSNNHSAPYEEADGPDESDFMNHEPLGNESQANSKRSVSAGFAIGIMGTLILGPFIGVILGFGAAYCTKKEGVLGDSARAFGDVAILSQEKAREIDQKHHVLEKSKSLAVRVWEKAKEMDKKHMILVKTKDFLEFCFTSVRNFGAEHHVGERTAEVTTTAKASGTATKIELASK